MHPPDEDIPDDFPIPQPEPFALTGFQLKVNLTMADDDRLYQRGAEPDRRRERYRECLEELEWSVDLLTEKLPKPKYQLLERDAILKMLGVNLVRDRGLTQAEAEWVIQKVLPRLTWPR